VKTGGCAAAKIHNIPTQHKSRPLSLSQINVYTHTHTHTHTVQILVNTYMYILLSRMKRLTAVGYHIVHTSYIYVWNRNVYHYYILLLYRGFTNEFALVLQMGSANLRTPLFSFEKKNKIYPINVCTVFYDRNVVKIISMYF